MHPDFEMLQHHGVELLVYRPWWRAGIVHGMTTSAMSFSGDRFSADVEVLRAAAQAECVVLPKQVHGDEVFDLRAGQALSELFRTRGDGAYRRQCDGVVCPSSGGVVKAPVAVGVMSADCVPVVLRGVDSYAVIHAGWRGLANGIVVKAASLIDGLVEGVVFASAGGDVYEVGAEVVKEIGPSAVYRASPKRHDAFLLDTARTAVKQLSEYNPFVKVVHADVCTISDTRFHSYRRDSDRAGRCVTFVCCSS